MADVENSCPCGSGNLLKECCQPVISDDSASCAEQLMRSRYTAFVLGDVDYLLRSWSDGTRPEAFKLGAARWLGLKIIEATDSTVSFEAAFDAGSKAMILKETSRFVCCGKHWRYVDGDCTTETVQRNDVCFCQSGLKYKRCCGRKPAYA
ncbi:MAG: YchJ family metal-binding protein [Mariprofundaceae bacterium]